MAAIKTPSIVNTCLIPIAVIHGPMANTKAVATMLRTTVIVTMASAIIYASWLGHLARSGTGVDSLHRYTHP